MKSRNNYNLVQKSINLNMMIFKLIFLSIYIYIFFFVDVLYNIKLCVSFLFFVNIFFIWVNRKNRFVFIISILIFWFNYSIFYANYFSSIQSSFFEDANTLYGIQGYKIVLSFILFLVIFTPTCKSNIVGEESRIFDFNMNPGNILAVGYLVVLAIILVFGFKRPVEQGERGTPTAIYEYSIILFIVGYYFFTKNKVYKIASTMLLLLYCLQNLAFGGRITALQLLLVLFFVWYDAKKIPWAKIIPIGVICLLIFSGIGEARANFSLSFSSLETSFKSVLKNAGTIDTAYSAYYTSLTFLKVEEFVSSSNRLQLFWAFVKSIILGGSVPDSNLAKFTMQYYLHYEGGVLPFFGQFYLGYFGIVFFSLIVVFYFIMIQRLDANSSGLKKCLAIYITVTTPRWYLYSPSQLLRGVLLLFIVFYVMKFACNVFIKANHNILDIKNGK